MGKQRIRKFNPWVKHRIERRDRMLSILAELKSTGYHYPHPAEQDIEYFLELVSS